MSTPDLKTLLIEYVAGTIKDSDREIVQEILDRPDPASREYVRQVLVTAAALTSNIAPVAPPTHMKHAILERIGTNESLNTTAQHSNLLKNIPIASKSEKRFGEFPARNSKSLQGRFKESAFFGACLAAGVAGVILGWQFVELGSNESSRPTSLAGTKKSSQVKTPSAPPAPAAQFVDGSERKDRVIPVRHSKSAEQRTFHGMLVLDTIAWQAHFLIDNPIELLSDESLLFAVVDKNGVQTLLQPNRDSNASMMIFSLPKMDLANYQFVVMLQKTDSENKQSTELLVTASLSSLSVSKQP